MKILAIDISGKVYKYDELLYRCIDKQIATNDAFTFACPYFSMQKNAKPLHLCSFVPAKYRSSSLLWKRMLKMLEGIWNYLLVLRYIKSEKIDVLHLQWLPFLEVCNWEKLWLKYIRKHNPSLRIILTTHNIYPHNSTDVQKHAYKRRLKAIVPLIDRFIVHNNTSKQAIIHEFGICSDHISIVHHGIFIPTNLPPRKRDDKKIRILLFGQQSLYKGTDILIKAIELLPHNILSNIEVHIEGTTDSQLYEQFEKQAKSLSIVWNNQYIDDDSLNQELQDADIIVYPYRAIAQSGALLLGLYFKKPVIISDLPAFIETLGPNYPKDLICETGNPQSLADAIMWYANHASQLHFLKDYIQKIIETNSWEEAAQKTIIIYK